MNVSIINNQYIITFLGGGGVKKKNIYFKYFCGRWGKLLLGEKKLFQTRVWFWRNNANNIAFISYGHLTLEEDQCEAMCRQCSGCYRFDSCVAGTKAIHQKETKKSKKTAIGHLDLQGKSSHSVSHYCSRPGRDPENDEHGIQNE